MLNLLAISPSRPCSKARQVYFEIYPLYLNLCADNQRSLIVVLQNRFKLVSDLQQTDPYERDCQTQILDGTTRRGSRVLTPNPNLTTYII